MDAYVLQLSSFEKSREVAVSYVDVSYPKVILVHSFHNYHVWGVEFTP